MKSTFIKTFLSVAGLGLGLLVSGQSHAAVYACGFTGKNLCDTFYIHAAKGKVLTYRLWSEATSTRSATTGGIFKGSIIVSSRTIYGTNQYYGSYKVVNEGDFFGAASGMKVENVPYPTRGDINVQD